MNLIELLTAKKLNKSQIAITEYAVQGYDCKQIALVVGLTPKTFKQYLFIYLC